MSIRQARETDLPAILAIEEQGMTASWSSGQLESEFFQPSSLLLVAEQDNLLQGYVSFRTFAPEAELMRLVVLPVWRRKGGADSLLHSGLQQLVDRRVRTCFLEVRSSNIPARALYAKHGFTDTGTRPKYYRQPVEDAVLMEKNMNGSLEGE